MSDSLIRPFRTHESRFAQLGLPEPSISPETVLLTPREGMQTIDINTGLTDAEHASYQKTVEMMENARYLGGCALYIPGSKPQILPAKALNRLRSVVFGI